MQKAVGQFGKALANLAKKAGPAIATILNVLAQVLTWGGESLRVPIQKSVDRSVIFNLFSVRHGKRPNEK